MLCPELKIHVGQTRSRPGLWPPLWRLSPREGGWGAGAEGMCRELGVNSSADPCPLATKPLPVPLLPCFPRMPAGLHGSRTTGSAALTFPIRRKRCFLASCEVCSGRAVGNDSGGAAAALPAPRGIPVLGRSTERIPGPAAPWIPGVCPPRPLLALLSPGGV